MQNRGFPQGIPLIAHAGVWGDLIVLTPLLAGIVGMYGNRWDAGDMLIAIAIGAAVTVGMGFLWVNGAKNGLPEAHTYDGILTAAGLIHAFYMALAIAIIILFFFFSDISQGAATIVALVLAIHVVYGTHIVLGLIGPTWYPARPHKELFTWIVILSTWGLLAWRCATIH